MPKFKILSNLIRAAIKTTTASTTTASDTTFKSLVSHFESITPPKPETSSKSKKQPETKPQSPPSPAVKSSPGALGLEDFYSETIPTAKDMAKTAKVIEKIINDVLKIKSLGLEEADDEKVVENVFKTPWLSNWKKNNIGIQRKEISYERKQKWIFKNSQVYRFDRLVDTCAFKLGTDATMDVFGMLGRETGLKEFNALMKMCIEQCRETDDENVAKEQISEVLELFISMKEQGFPIEEETYGPFLMLLIDKESMMKRRFRNFAIVFVLIMGTRISVYELLETVDITKLSLLGNAVSIFKSLGRLSLEYYVEKFLLVLKNCDYGAEDISTLIFSYATSIPNLAVEDVVSKFKTLHTVMEMSPSSTSYERLIVYSCNSLKVHHAIDMVDQLCEEGFTISINTIHSMLNASEASLDFNLFDGAIGLLNDLKKLNLTPTAGMYNAIMDGYFREKNISGALMVLEQMKLADVKPDSATYSCLISNCDNEDQITKCYEEMKVAGIQVSKQSIYGAY